MKKDTNPKYDKNLTKNKHTYLIKDAYRMGNGQKSCNVKENYMYVCVCVCVCVSEREREREIVNL